MERLNIAFYSDTYLPAVDGVVKSMLNFRKELERRGHNVYIFASSDISNLRKYSNKKVFLYAGTTFKPYPQYSVAIFPYYSMIRLPQLRIDLIHSQTPFMMGFAGMMGAKISGIPLAGSFHTMINNRTAINSYYPKNRGFRRFASKYLWKYTKYFYKRCDVTIAPSSVIMQKLKKMKISRLTVVPNSIDTKIFNTKVSGEEIRNRLGIKSRDKVVLYVGRMSREKKIETMLKAAKTLTKKNESIKFVLGGTGPALNHYKRLARKLNVQRNVTFLGFVEERMLPKLYAASDLLCMPSTFETQGIVCIEAMACGKPVVGADFLALKEIIKNGENGEKFAPGDYIACARKIEKVLNSDEPYKRNVTSVAKEFSIEKTTDKLLDVYNLILNNKAI